MDPQHPTFQRLLTLGRLPRVERTPQIPHQKFAKIPRFNREIIITEKIDGTNGVVYVDENQQVWAGSRNRWLTVEADNFGFAAWVHECEDELEQLGPGFHYGEWYGRGIQRNYGLNHRRFALFNVSKWADPHWRPACCGVVPTLFTGFISTPVIDSVLWSLCTRGSATVPGFMNPEGIVIYHTAANQLFKVTLENDGQPKGVNK